MPGFVEDSVKAQEAKQEQSRHVEPRSLTGQERQLLNDIAAAQDRIKQEYVSLKPANGASWSNEEYRKLENANKAVSQLGELRHSVEFSPAKVISMEYGQDAPGVKQFVDRAKQLGYTPEADLTAQKAAPVQQVEAPQKAAQIQTEQKLDRSYDRAYAQGGYGYGR